MSSFKLKIILLGTAAVGKTSLVQRYSRNRYDVSYKMTTGVDIVSKDVEFRQGEIATLSIWDIGGQQRFEDIRGTFYKGAAGTLLVFDLTRERTFEEMKKWLSEIRQFAGKNIPFVLIGNKADLMLDVGTVIDRDEASSFAENEGSIYIETSAKTGVNVEWAFTYLTQQIIERRSNISKVIKKDIKGESYDKESVQKENKRLDFLIEYKDLINSRVREILRSSKKEDFRFLIVGNEKSQIHLLSKLLSVEGVVWPPEAINILYNTSKYKMNLYSKDWEFEVFFLSNMKKLNENKEIFFDACKNSNGIIVFYNPETREDYSNAADMCINLRNSFPDLEIILTTGSEDISAPANLELERYEELEKLEKNYQINNYDDHESIISEILINVLKRKKKFNKETNLMTSKLKEMQNQLSNQKDDPYNFRKKTMEFIISVEKAKRTVPSEFSLSMEKPEKMREIKPEKILKMDYIDDFAISFAGEDRLIARSIADALKNVGVKIFYDKFFESDLVGKKLSVKFQEKYGSQTRYLIVLISKYYNLKDWTNLELTIAKEEAKARRDEFIIPIRLDDTAILGIHDDIGFIDYNKKGLDGTVKILLEKLKGAKLRESRD